MVLKKIFSILLLMILTLSFSNSVSAKMSDEDMKSFIKMSKEERDYLLMYFDEDELVVVSSTRSLKSISRVAENVEVVTEEDIELMNAHTLADVLNTVNGVVIQFAGAGPGSPAMASIQGSSVEHVLVMIDGIAFNTGSDQADLGVIPARIIDKVEIIKGPASSAWGSSLGGVINVITKSPGNSGKPGGNVSASYGKKNTADMNAEITGRNGKFGYYISAGRLQTDGLRPLQEISANDLYLKLNYTFSDRTNLGMSLSYYKNDREWGDFSVIDLFMKDRNENLYAAMNLNSSLSNGLDLNLSLRAARLNNDIESRVLSSGEGWTDNEDHRKYGASAKLSWKTGMHNIVFGSDYDYKKILGDYFDSPPTMNIFAVYANDTITLNKLAISLGLRYDHSGRDADFVSPSLGLTYDVFEKTIFRANVARGFHLSPIGGTTNDGVFYRHNPDLKPEEVWSYQAGLESGLLKYVWLKTTVFRHDISDAIVMQDVDADAGTWTIVNQDKVRREGVELALRSMKFYDFTLSAAATFVNIKNRTTGEDIHEWPDHTYDISLKYDDEKSLRGLIKGRYVAWQGTGGYNPKGGFIFDVNVIKKIFKKQDSSLEVFVTGHNIFDGLQYWDDLYINAKPWAEAGLIYKF